MPVRLNRITSLYIEYLACRSLCVMLPFLTKHYLILSSILDTIVKEKAT